MASTRVWYPGRIGLLGEHCDWAGGASLTAPTPMGIEVEAESAREGVLVRSDLDGQLLEHHFCIERGTSTAGPLRFIPAIIDHLIELGLNLVPAEVWIRSDLPSGRGLSSSAAFTLSVTDAWTRLSGHEMTSLELAEAAYQIEHRHLGVACGRLDPVACAAARPLMLHWDPSGALLRTTPVNPIGTFHLVVAVAESPRNTSLILQTLNQAYRTPIGDHQGDAVREAIAEFGAASERGARALQMGDAPALGRSMNDVQRIYDVNLAANLPPLYAPTLKEIIDFMNAKNSLGAKFSGAGGGGSVVALFTDQSTARGAAIELEQRGLSAWYIPLNAV